MLETSEKAWLCGTGNSGRRNGNCPKVLGFKKQLDNCRMDINRIFDIADTLRGCVPSVIKHHIVVCIHNIAEGNSEKYEFEDTEEE